MIQGRGGVSRRLVIQGRGGDSRNGRLFKGGDVVQRRKGDSWKGG